MNTLKVNADPLRKFMTLFRAKDPSSAEKWFSHIFSQFQFLSKQYNNSVESKLLRTAVQSIDKAHAQNNSLDLFVGNSFWSLYVSCNSVEISFYLVQSAQIPTAKNCLVDSERKARVFMNGGELSLAEGNSGKNLLVTEFDGLLLTLFNDLVSRSHTDFEGLPIPLRLKLNSGSVTSLYNSMLQQKQNLALSLVSSQERLQERFSQELHDEALGQMLFLKGQILDETVTREECCRRIDSISAVLREICRSMTPRDISEWGLELVVRDLLHSLAKRTGIGTKLSWDKQVPEYAEEVQVQIFRILQESLRNVEKHADASNVTVSAVKQDDGVVFEVRDDGRGFSEVKKRSSFGLSIMRERAELLSLSRGCELTITSEQGIGTMIQLVVSNCV